MYGQQSFIPKAIIWVFRLRLRLYNYVEIRGCFFTKESATMVISKNFNTVGSSVTSNKGLALLQARPFFQRCKYDNLQQ